MGARATRTNASGLSPLAHGPDAMLPQRLLRERGAHARTHGPKAVTVTIGRGPGRSRWSRAIGGAFLGRRARPTRRDATRACRDGRRGRLSPRPLPGPARVTVTGRRGRLPAAGAATAGPSPAGRGGTLCTAVRLHWGHRRRRRAIGGVRAAAATGGGGGA